MNWKKNLIACSLVTVAGFSSKAVAQSPAPTRIAHPHLSGGLTLSMLKSLYGKKYIYIRNKHTRFPSGSEKNTTERIVVSFQNQNLFKYTRKAISPDVLDDTNLFYDGSGKVFTEKANGKQIRITRFFRDSLYASLHFHPAFLLPEFGTVKEVMKGELRVLYVDAEPYFYEITYDKNDFISNVKRSKKGEKNFEFRSTEMDDNGFPVAFEWKKFWKGKPFVEASWKLDLIQTLTEKEAEESNFIYQFKPGYRVTDVTGKSYFTGDLRQGKK